MICAVQLAHGVLFFFQAEDGIRDYKVTGVQTCALPIFGVDHDGGATTPTRNGLRTALLSVLDHLTELRFRFCHGPEIGVHDICRTLRRSEERRVGKECRSRWSPYH